MTGNSATTSSGNGIGDERSSPDTIKLSDDLDVAGEPRDQAEFAKFRERFLGA
jgi:hypothetical protein